MSLVQKSKNISFMPQQFFFLFPERMILFKDCLTELYICIKKICWHIFSDFHDWSLCTLCLAGRPFCGRVLRVEGIFELYHHSIPLLQLPLVLHIILHQLSQGGKLFPSIEIIVLPIVLNLYMGHFRLPPVKQ